VGIRVVDGFDPTNRAGYFYFDREKLSLDFINSLRTTQKECLMISDLICDGSEEIHKYSYRVHKEHQLA
jgi:hypothetical protein